MKNELKKTPLVSHDLLGSYDQNRINGFSERLLNKLIATIQPEHSSRILDAMSGNGNLSSCIIQHCRRKKIAPPHLTLLDHSLVQCRKASQESSLKNAEICWGDILTLQSHDTGKSIGNATFDCVVIKSGNHEIPRSRQRNLYQKVFEALKPGGVFVNLGFLFDEPGERKEFAEITRLKDSLLGLKHAARNRHFLTREELYSNLESCGFQDIRCAFHFSYRIHSCVVSEEYFSRRVNSRQMEDDLQSCQARARTLRRNGRIFFEGAESIMRCPGEITVAQKPGDHSIEDGEIFRLMESYAFLLERVMEWIPKNSSVLEIGGRNELLAEKIQNHAKEYMNLYKRWATTKSFKKIKNKDFKIKFKKFDFGKNGIPYEGFDVAVALNSLNDSSMNPLQALKTFYAALRPGGRLVLNLFSKKLALKDRTHKQNILTWSPEGLSALLLQLGFRSIVHLNTDTFRDLSFFLVAEK